MARVLRQAGTSLWAALLLASCNSSPRASTPYSTLPDVPTRDSIAAQKANEEGLKYIQQHDDAAAEAAFREALGCDITCAAAHNNLGLILLRKERWYEASWEFAYAAKLQPNASTPRGNLGLVFEAVGKYDRAIEEFEAALRINSEDVQVMGYLARAMTKSRRPEQEARLKELLDKLVLQAEPDWSDWAREQLIRLEQ